MEETLQGKIDKAHVTSALRAHNYHEVVRVLSPHLNATQSDRASAIPHHERLYLLEILVEAYRGCSNYPEALQTGRALLREAIKDTSNTIAHVRQAMLVLLSCVDSMRGSMVASFEADFKELLHKTASLGVTHCDRYTSQQLIS